MAGTNGARQAPSSANSPLPVAILGGGYLSAIGRTHITALTMDRRFDVVAGCFSQQQYENESSASGYGVTKERTYVSLREMLEQEAKRVAAFVLLTPTDQHAPQVIECLGHKVPIICEKALATSVGLVQEIGREVEVAGGFLVVTYNYLGYPMLRELRRLILNGNLGHITQLFIEMPQEGFVRRSADDLPIEPQGWRLRDHEVPTISLDLGVHLHSIARFLTEQKPEKVVAVQQSFGNFSNVIDNVVCLAQYSSQIHCTFWFSKAALGYRNGLKVRIFGTRGSAAWEQMNPEFIDFADCFGRRTIIDRADPAVLEAGTPRYARFKAGHPAGFIEAFANYYSDVADALIVFRNIGRQVANSNVLGVETALEGMRLLESAARSAKTGNWVTCE